MFIVVVRRFLAWNLQKKTILSDEIIECSPLNGGAPRRGLCNEAVIQCTWIYSMHWLFICTTLKWKLHEFQVWNNGHIKNYQHRCTSYCMKDSVVRCPLPTLCAYTARKGARDYVKCNQWPIMFHLYLI